MQRYGGFGRWTNIWQTFARGCGDTTRDLRQCGEEAAESCRDVENEKYSAKSGGFSQIFAYLCQKLIINKKGT